MMRAYRRSSVRTAMPTDVVMRAVKYVLDNPRHIYIRQVAKDYKIAKSAEERRKSGSENN